MEKAKRYRIKALQFEPSTREILFETDSPEEKWKELCRFIPKVFLETTASRHCKMKDGTVSSLQRFFVEKILPFCAAIVIEYPFYESDYLSTYYLYHARKFQAVDKECCRLILYLDANCQECLGYVSLRPIASERKIGRSYLEPQIFVDQMGSGKDFFVIQGKYKIHTEGKEIVVRAMPYMQQEGVVSVCAHVAIWTILRFFSSRFANSKEYTMGDVVELIKSPQVRKIPSKGLSVEQVSTALMDAGFSTIVIRKKTEMQPGEMMSELIAYIDSGIPVICISERESHAVVACGRSKSNEEALVMAEDENDESFSTRLNLLMQKEEKEGTQQVEENQQQIILESSCVEWIVVNDDNRAPYFGINSSPQCHEEHMGIVDFSLIDFCIVPLYSRMRLSYADAKSVFMVLAQKSCLSEKTPNGEGYLWTAHKDATTFNKKQKENLIVKIFLTSANTFKEYLRENIDKEKAEKGKTPNELWDLLDIPYSRFIWVAQIADLDTYREGMCSGFVVLDTTCSLADSNVVIALADQKHFEFVKENVRTHKMQAFSAEYENEGLKMPLFNQNCRLVKCNNK